MHKPFAFHFGSASTPLDAVTDIHYRERAAAQLPIPSKPVKVFHTHGLQVVGVPDELLRILGAPTIRKANQSPLVVSAHFETEACFYLLRIHSRIHMALPR
ncbi:hypothetical protein GCM10027399_14350 [Curvibacter fontanus]|jgi:hypothetical protein|uniref:hypothetical protein n=1 Tax=Hydrogenophaga sp. TaxID=1904254 RepID=UPI002721D944|nr:hypothetical protein [Hydrogenophaga sp.]MDO9220922.1 hypothetical protein [Thiobacillus sp.]MDP1619589.1 hypothetical protein [bacterium]MDP1936166.1 hypothetical protein [Hylemonella sp.]MDZ4102470.1 hypothetical protein [Hydrogenophaga sp.]